MSPILEGLPRRSQPGPPILLLLREKNARFTPFVGLVLPNPQGLHGVNAGALTPAILILTSSLPNLPNPERKNELFQQIY
ncbi:MAG: hypothetical protein EA367_00270 [Leptolyngbya sp. DLM2.Bin15]|nr:MAG: hypothetical protein EA367_00270 [Leptolyngbya sp. DLM2.Bin15]